jgi:uncharacterized protein DUF5666
LKLLDNQAGKEIPEPMGSVNTAVDSPRSSPLNLKRGWRVAAASVALFLVSAIPSTALAAGLSFQGTNFTLDGKITEHTANKLTVSTEENIIFHVRYTEKTEVKRQDGTAASEKDLRVGVKIHVDGDLNDSGEIAAQKIEIETESAPPK